MNFGHFSELVGGRVLKCIFFGRGGGNFRDILEIYVRLTLGWAFLVACAVVSFYAMQLL